MQTPSQTSTFGLRLLLRSARNRVLTVLVVLLDALVPHGRHQ